MPAGVVVEVVTASVEFTGLGLDTDGGVKEPEAPAGRPAMLYVTVPLNPPDGVMVTV